MKPNKILLVAGVLGTSAVTLCWTLWKFHATSQENASAALSSPETTGDRFFDSAPRMKRPDADTVLRFSAIEAERKRWDETIWAEELAAERHEEVFIRLWDELRNAEDPCAVLGGFQFGELIVGKPGPPEELDHAVVRTRIEGPGHTWNAAEWKQQLRKLKESGFHLEQSEWRHPRFSLETNGAARSVMAMTLHISNPARQYRITVKGDLGIEWEWPADVALPPFPRVIEVTHLEMLARTGPPPFSEVLVQEISPHPGSQFIDPLILHDLDGDGLSEIILGCNNLVFRNHGRGRFEVEPLCARSPGLINAAVIADFNGDGAADFLCCNRQGLLLCAGDPQGRFPGEPRRAWSSPVKLLNPFVITCGDIDGDGDLDVWMAQYKLPYFGGQMPTPYYDANDGFPAFLLINDGAGCFLDATEQAGLGAKRFRRTYSSSFVDLDGDSDLDLVVVSDFAGADVYYNDSHGRFTDVTTQVLDEPHAFGMAHSFADFDGDGQLDLLMIGMDSCVAQRLDWMRAGPPNFPQHHLMRPKMGYGNRLYFSRDGVFRHLPLSEQVARTGWSWGCASFDFDNDGDLDLYVANGHKSRPSAKDYEPQFWRHDIYAATSRHDPALDLYFGATGERLYGSGQSYGGYQNNRLLMNRAGREFVEVGYLMGVALEEDCRNVVSDDLDGDGREDLIVTTFEEWPNPRQTLRVFHNEMEDAGNWIGFRLRDSGPGKSPVGARITLTTAGQKQIRTVITGDSHRAQQANVARFGLGPQTNIIDMELHWPGGRTQKWGNLAVNQYHEVQVESPGDSP